MSNRKSSTRFGDGNRLESIRSGESIRIDFATTTVVVASRAPVVTTDAVRRWSRQQSACRHASIDVVAAGHRCRG